MPRRLSLSRDITFAARRWAGFPLIHLILTEESLPRSPGAVIGGNGFGKGKQPCSGWFFFPSGGFGGFRGEGHRGCPSPPVIRVMGQSPVCWGILFYVSKPSRRWGSLVVSYNAIKWLAVVVNSLGLPDELRCSLRSQLRYTILSYMHYTLYTLY